MKLTDLFLNRWLYKVPQQNIETKDAVYDSSNIIPVAVPPLSAGSAAQDINVSNVTINGDTITPGTIPPALLDVANWGWGQTSVFSSASATQVNWGAGTFKSASGISYAISAGNTGIMGAKNYIYLDLNVSSTAYQVTTNPALAVGVGKVLIAVANPDVATATFNLTEATQITGDNILANSINASKIVTGQLIVGTNVGIGTAQDSAGVTTIIGNVVTTGFVNALSVVAGSVAADNITGTTITGKTIKTGADGVNRLEIIRSGTTNANYITWKDTVDSIVAYFFSDSSGNLVISADASISISVIGVGQVEFYSVLGCHENIIMSSGKTVDGVDISALATNYNALVIDYGAHVGNASAHHSSVSNGLNITPASIVCSGLIRPSSNNSYNLGSSSYYFATAYLSKIELLSSSTDPSSRTYGQIWHHYEGGAGPKNFRGTPWNTDIYTFDMTAV